MLLHADLHEVSHALLEMADVADAAVAVVHDCIIAFIVPHSLQQTDAKPDSASPLLKVLCLLHLQILAIKRRFVDPNCAMCSAATQCLYHSSSLQQPLHYCKPHNALQRSCLPLSMSSYV